MMAVVHDLAEAQGAMRSTSPRVACHVLRSRLFIAVGDIAPREGIFKAEKRRLETVREAISPHISFSVDSEGGPAQEAMQNFVHEMLHDSPAALKIMSLWTEYEEQTTAEARFVKGKVSSPFS